LRGGIIMERGLRPLSYIHPSPANNNCGFLSVLQAGEGSGVRYRKVKNRQSESKPFGV
jgi:hypothetical protein